MDPQTQDTPQAATPAPPARPGKAPQVKAPRAGLVELPPTAPQPQPLNDLAAAIFVQLVASHMGAGKTREHLASVAFDHAEAFTAEAERRSKGK